MRRWPIQIALLFAALALALAMVGCGGSDDDSTPSTNAVGTTPKFNKPEVTPPDDPPPSELEIEDLEEGSGKEAKAGAVVSVNYHIVDYTTGKVYASSWDGLGPYSFKLGAEEVVPGIEQGIDGMKIGGRRELIVPPDLGFAKEYGEFIGPNPQGVRYPKTTLIVVVELVGVLSQSA